MLLFWVQTLLYLLTADKGGYLCFSSHLIYNQREYLIIAHLNSEIAHLILVSLIQ